MAAVDEFLQTPPEQILAELKAIRAEKALLGRKEKMLEELAAIHIEQGNGQALEGSVGTLRDQIKAVMTTRPRGRAWMPREILPELAKRGTDVSIDHIRMTMTRMAEGDELVRPKQRQLIFKLPGNAA